MRNSRWSQVTGILLWVAGLVACSTLQRSSVTGVQRLYVFNCGEAHIADLSPWTPGANVGQAAVFSDNCYLIVHGTDRLLWDSGYSDRIAMMPAGMPGPRSTAYVTQTLMTQFAELGMEPAQITHLAFSHSHSDHVGNANLFTVATLYIQQAEYDAAFGPEPGRFGFAPGLYAKLRDSTTIKLNGDHDLFGDGSVQILATPGHTPGHQSLLVRLPKSGAIVLSGDAAHFRENFEQRRVPGFNFNLDLSRQSMDKLARVVAAEHAQLWINHDSVQSAGLPHSPQFVE